MIERIFLTPQLDRANVVAVKSGYSSEVGLSIGKGKRKRITRLKLIEARRLAYALLTLADATEAQSN